MGYTTEFDGKFKFSKELTMSQYKTLKDFAEQRHGDNLKEHEECPSFYCQWVPTDDGKYLEWDGNEKFYSYIEWLEILIEKFFNPWKIKLNGEVTWEGEESGDLGKIVVKNNVVTAKQARIVYD